VIKNGDIQVMSAGTGIQHSEYNKNKNQEVKFLQIWVFPNKKNVTPRYDQMTLNIIDRKNKLQQIVSPNPRDEGVWIHQNAWFHLAEIDNGFSTNYQLTRDTPFVFIKLVTQFINKVNKEIKSMPESYEIVNNFNNYMPLTSQLKKYTENKGINKFYKDIGVDYNLYADTPPNSPIELIKIIKASREYTDAETKYVITFVIKKILKSVSDQLQITVHFVTKNDPLEGYNLFNGEPPAQAINSTQQVAIEFVFIDGYFTNDFDVDYDCVGTDNNCKKFSNIDGDDKYYSFDALGTEFLTSDYEIIKQFNKKNREHEIEMNNFNINVPYPVYENPHEAKTPKFPREAF
jgi:hypothetical protein